MTKIAEGGFNKIFRIVMDNNSTVIARIPYPNVGRSCKTTASEVATMEFVSRLFTENEAQKLTSTFRRLGILEHLPQKSSLGVEKQITLWDPNIYL